MNTYLIAYLDATSSPPIHPQLVMISLSEFVPGVQTVRYSELASSMIIIFDHLITFDQEVELIWKSGWSWGKVLFLLNRYYTLCAVIFNNYVLFSPHISQSGITGITAFMLGELILQLRIYALYDLNKKVLALMGSVFVSAIVASSIIMGKTLASIDAVSISLFGTSSCVPLNLQTVPYFYAFWIPIMVSESLLCGLAIFRAFQSYRRRSTMLESGRALIAVLIRDSILYFVILLVVYLCNTIIFLQNNVVDTESAISYAVSMSCVMGNRLCLNVRGMIWQDGRGSSYHESGLGPITPQSFRDRSRPWPIVVEGHRHERSAQLTEYEMHELRVMSASVQPK